MKKSRTLTEHLQSIASKGGKALLKKRGAKYFSDLAKRKNPPARRAAPISITK